MQAEEAALPLKISKLQEALHLEEAELQRRESGIQNQSDRPAVPTRYTCSGALLLQPLPRRSLQGRKP